MAIVRAVAVPSEPKRSGTTTKSVEAGVTQDSVRRVPPTTPMERLSLAWPCSSASGTALSAGRRVSVMVLHGTPTKTGPSIDDLLRNP